MSRIPRIRRRARGRAGLAGALRSRRSNVRRAHYPGGEASMTAGTRSAPAWLSFRRIVDIPFGTCVAALESWQRTGQDGELRIGHSLVRGPVSTIATPVPAGWRSAWPGDDCARCCG